MSSDISTGAMLGIAIPLFVLFWCVSCALQWRRMMHIPDDRSAMSSLPPTGVGGAGAAGYPGLGIVYVGGNAAPGNAYLQQQVMYVQSPGMPPQQVYAGQPGVAPAYAVAEPPGGGGSAYVPTAQYAPQQHQQSGGYAPPPQGQAADDYRSKQV